MVIDWALLYAAGGAHPDRAHALAVASAEFLPTYGLTTPERIIQFMGQAAHETQGFLYLAELGGPYYCQQYDGRDGNCYPGDGYKFKGRGIFQITGRTNYALAAKRFATDFLSHPELLELPNWAVRTAGDFWVREGLGALADRSDTDGISRHINGRHCNTLNQRRARIAQMRAAVAGMAK